MKTFTVIINGDQMDLIHRALKSYKANTLRRSNTINPAEMEQLETLVELTGDPLEDDVNQWTP